LFITARQRVAAEDINVELPNEFVENGLSQRILQIQRNAFLAGIRRNEITVPVVIDNLAADVAIGIAGQALAVGCCFDSNYAPALLGATPGCRWERPRRLHR